MQTLLLLTICVGVLSVGLFVVSEIAIWRMGRVRPLAIVGICSNYERLIAAGVFQPLLSVFSLVRIRSCSFLFQTWNHRVS